MLLQKICNSIEKHAFELGFECTLNDNLIKVSHPSTAFQLHVDVKSERNITIYVSVRLSSWQVIDERTDFHEILSILFAAYVRCNSPYLNCAFVDMDHPILDMPTEIYFRQIVFTQPLNGGNGYVTFSLKQTKDFMALLLGFNYLTRIFIGFDHDSNRTFKLPCLEIVWVKKLENFFGNLGNLYQTKSRINPDWLHYRNVEQGISMIESVNVAHALKQMIHKLGNNKSIRYENFDLIFNKKNENVRVRRHTVEGYKALNFFSEGNHKIYNLFLDYALVMIKGDYLYIHYIPTGRPVVEYVKKDIVKRRKLENKLLFREESYFWKKNICPEKFENFCISLLSLLPQTISVRKASPLNEPDEGMDIIWEISSIAKRAIDENISPIMTQRIVVQCKASNKSLGKGQVVDIGDTIDYHNASGYYLITSAPAITRTLRNALIRRKDKGYNVDWWARFELENFIDEYPQLLSGNEAMMVMA